jgi:hypothetical protein
MNKLRASVAEISVLSLHPPLTRTTALGQFNEQRRYVLSVAASRQNNYYMYTRN